LEEARPMSAEHNKQAVREMSAAFSAGDIDKAFAFYADEIQWTITGTTSYSGTYRGKQDLRERLMGKLGEDLEGGLKITIDNIIAEGDYVVYQSHGQAKTKRGADYNNTYCMVYRFADGKVAEVTEYLDTELVRRVLG